MTNQIKTGALYEPRDLSDSGCGEFDSVGGRYISFTGLSDGYLILDKNRGAVGKCSDCLHPDKKNVRLAERILDNVMEGEVLVEGDNNRRLVLARTGRMVALSTDQNEHCSLHWHSIQELKDSGFSYPDVSKEKTIEIEGKKFTAAELKALIKTAE